MIVDNNDKGIKELTCGIPQNMERLCEKYKEDVYEIFEYSLEKFKNDCEELNNLLLTKLKRKLQEKFKIIEENENVFHIYWDNMEYEKGKIKYQ
jgi:hypothetical protein